MEEKTRSDSIANTSNTSLEVSVVDLTNPLHLGQAVRGAGVN